MSRATLLGCPASSTTTRSGPLDSFPCFVFACSNYDDEEEEFENINIQKAVQKAIDERIGEGNLNVEQPE